jgi:hypothetical protein
VSENINDEFSSTLSKAHELLLKQQQKVEADVQNAISKIKSNFPSLQNLNISATASQLKPSTLNPSTLLKSTALPAIKRMISKPTPHMLKVEPALAWDPSTLIGVGAVAVDQLDNMYQKIHQYLSDSGADGVKVDAQGKFCTRSLLAHVSCLNILYATFS